MGYRRLLVFSSLLVLISLALLSYVGIGERDNFSERVKIALRDSGNRLLLANKDSSSLTLPIIELDKGKFELSFQKRLSIVPDSLVNIMRQSLSSSRLPDSYIVEVINPDDQISYSYEINKDEEKNIIPCIGRHLPSDYYKIKILFLRQESFLIVDKNYSLLSLAVIGFVGFGLLYWRKDKNSTLPSKAPQFSRVGNYKFYKEQNKLVKGSTTIVLTAKECELISIFSRKPNQIIKRDSLVKEVWEDKGVFVGRSLDTYISKIRKKFKDDDSTNIVSIHGVGYKLEISSN